MANKIKTTTEFIYRLKTKNINISDFDYKEGKTTDKYLESHPLIFRGKRFYLNPYFWSFLFDEGLEDEIDFLYNMREFKPSYSIMTVFITTANLKIADRYFKELANRYFDIAEKKEQMMNDLMVDCSTVNNITYYLILKEIAQDKDIKPLYSFYSNAGEGYCLYNACKFEDPNFANYLLDHEADVTLNDSMAFAVACKEGNYNIALRLANLGANIHTKNDLGLAMIHRNDRLNKPISDKNTWAKKELLKLFEEGAKNEEVKNNESTDSTIQIDIGNDYTNSSESNDQTN